MDTIPIKSVYEQTRNTIVEQTGYRPEKINMRKLLNYSLNENELSVSEIVSKYGNECIANFEDLNEYEKNRIIEYILNADLLKRDIWGNLTHLIHSLIQENKLIEVPFYTDESKQQTSSIKEKSKQNDYDFKTAVEDFTVILVGVGKFFVNDWGSFMESECEQETILYKRYRELKDLILKMYQDIETAPSIESTIRAGYITGVEFPMGMLCYLPELLEAQHIPVTQEIIFDHFLKNVSKVSATIAAQDFVTFQTIEQIFDTDDGTIQPADFSIQKFTLDKEGIIAFKGMPFTQDAVIPTIIDHLGQTSSAFAASAEEHYGVAGNYKEFKVPWKSCPALFSNVISKYKDFFEPIVKQILELQKQYK